MGDSQRGGAASPKGTLSRWHHVGSRRTGKVWRSRLPEHCKLTTRVYTKLCFALVTSVVGSYLHILLNIGGLLTCLDCMAWLRSIPPYEELEDLEDAFKYGRAKLFNFLRVEEY